MPVGAELVGRRFDAVVVCVADTDRVRSFADAVGLPGSVPPTFLPELALRGAIRVLDKPESGLAGRFVVLREHSFTARGPVRLGERFSVAVTVLSTRTVAGSDLVVTEQEISGGADDVVLTSTLTLTVSAVRR